MKKTAILCLFLMTAGLTFAQNDNPFMDPEIAPRVELNNVFEACFIKTAVTNIAQKTKNTFKYEFTYNAVVIYRHTVFGNSASDFTYADKWFYIPLNDLYINNNETVKDVFAETTEIALTNKAKAIIAGNGIKYNLAGGDTFLQNEINIPFILTKRFYNREVFEFLNSNLSVLRAEVKESVAKKEAISPKDSRSKPVEPATTIKKEYYPTGELAIEFTMIDGKIEGKETGYYKSGKINYFYTYKNNVKNGAYEYYFENGQVRQKSYLKNDQFDGALQEYYENGILKNESVNIDGKYHGFIKEYSPDGKLVSKKYYVMGRLSGTLDACEGVIYLIKKLDDKQDKQLDDKSWIKENFAGIMDFRYEFFSEGSFILNRASQCRLDFLPESETNEIFFAQYEKVKAQLNNCGKLKAEEEHYENSSMGTLKSIVYRYNKSLFVKLQATTLSNGSIRLYVCRTENKKDGIR